MNDKTKKKLKKAGIIAGCVVGGGGLAYAGYLAGTGYFHINGIKTSLGIRASTTSGYAMDLCTKKPWMLGKMSVFPFTKDECIEVVKEINKILQEAN